MKFFSSSRPRSFLAAAALLFSWSSFAQNDHGPCKFTTNIDQLSGTTWVNALPAQDLSQLWNNQYLWTNTVTPNSQLFQAPDGAIYFVDQNGKLYSYSWMGDAEYENLPVHSAQSFTIDAKAGLAFDGPNTIFCVGTDKLVYRFVRSGGAWSSAQFVSSQWQLADARGGLQFNNYKLFCVGIDGKLYNFWLNGSNWQFDAIDPNQGTGWGSKLVNPVGRFLLDPGHIFYIGTDGVVYNYHWTGAWTPAPLATQWDAYASVPVTVSATSGLTFYEFKIFCVGANGIAYNFYWNQAGGQWVFARVCDLQYHSIVSGGRLSGSSSASKIFTVGQDGNVYNFWWDGIKWNFNQLALQGGTVFNAFTLLYEIDGKIMGVVPATGKIGAFTYTGSTGYAYSYQQLSANQNLNCRTATYSIAAEGNNLSPNLLYGSGAQSLYYVDNNNRIGVLYKALQTLDYTPYQLQLDEDFQYNAITDAGFVNNWHPHYGWGRAADPCFQLDVALDQNLVFAVDPSNSSDKILRLRIDNTPVTTKVVDYLPPNYCIECNNDNVCDPTNNIDKYNNRTFNYSGAAIASKAQYDYGLYEIRCKMPSNNDDNHGAFWLFNGLREYDVFEYLPFFSPTMNTNCLHWWKPEPHDHCGMTYYPKDALGNPIDYTQGYHTFSCIWLPDRLEFYVDGVALRTIKHHVGQYNKQSILASIGITPLGSPFNGTYPAYLDVDYIRYYKHPAYSVLCINTQPADQTVCAGSNVTMSVAAGGNSLSYQWYFNNALIPGATAANYTITGVNTSQAGSYKVTVTDPYATVTSNACVLTVATPTAITQQPLSQTGYAGNTVAFGVTATGGNLSYQWYFNSTPVGTNSPVLTLSNLSSANAGNYYVVVTGLCGPAVTSNTVTLNVQPSPGSEDFTPCKYKTDLNVPADNWANGIFPDVVGWNQFDFDFPVHGSSQLFRGPDQAIYFVDVNSKLRRYFWDGDKEFEVQQLDAAQPFNIEPKAGLAFYGNTVFCIGTDQLLYKFEYVNGVWYSSQAAAVQSQPVDFRGGLIQDAGHIFCIGTDQKIYNLYYFANAWNFAALDGTQGSTPLTSALAAPTARLATGGGRVFYVGTNGFVYDYYYGTFGWTGEKLDATQTFSSVQYLASIPAGLLYYENKIFFTATNGRLCNFYLTGTTWNFAPLIATPPFNVNVYCRLVGSSYAAGRIFCLATNGKYYYYQWAGTSWQMNQLSTQQTPTFFVFSMPVEKGNKVYVAHNTDKKIYVFTESAGVYNFQQLTPNQNYLARMSNVSLPTYGNNLFDRLILSPNDNIIHYVGLSNNQICVLYERAKTLNYSLFDASAATSFHDEFMYTSSTTAPFTTRWKSGYDWGNTANICNYKEINVPQNLTFVTDPLQPTDQFLRIVLNNTPVVGLAYPSDPPTQTYNCGTWTEQNQQTFPYQGGTITSQTGYGFGLYEIRCKIPAGGGMWPAFWLFNGPNEHDVFEFLGHDVQTISNNDIWYAGNYTVGDHCGVEYRLKNGANFVDLTQDFHTLSLVWMPGRLEYYIDGKETRTVKHHVAPASTSNPNQPQVKEKIIANMGVSEYFTAPTGGFPYLFDVDYIRYYEPIGMPQMAPGGGGGENPNRTAQQMIETMTAIGRDKAEYYQQLAAKFEEKQADIVTLHPNPSGGEFQLGLKTNECSIAIYNSLGELVRHYTGVPAGTLDVSLGDCADGIYMVRVQSGEKMKTIKYVLAR